MPIQKTISRRTALRGLGVSMTLPWLEMMRPAASAATGMMLNDAGAPKRMAFVFVPNGVNLAKWTPEKTGYDYDLPEVLEPLRRVQDQVMVISGLTHDKGRSNGDGPGDHARSASVFLTGAQPRKTASADIRSGVSVDQHAAQQIGRLTRFPSLEVGIESGKNVGNCDSGYSCAYSHNIAWASPTQPLAKETNPRLVFERLFSDHSTGGDKVSQKRLALKQSLLSFVAEDAQRLNRSLGRTDRRKMDEYMNAVRDIEHRIELSEKENAAEQPQAKINGFAKPLGTPTDFADHVRLITDMMVLAFQTDSTRVASCMFGRAGSNLSYRKIGVPDGHHNLSHHGGNPEKLNKIAAINRYHVGLFAYFLERLNSIPEGNGTLLDNTMVMYGSAISDGNRHNNENLPILLAGSGGGTIRSGRHVVVDEETPACNLFLSLLDRMDCAVDRMGDSTGRLSVLS